MRKAIVLAILLLALSIGSGTAPADPVIYVKRSGNDLILTWPGSPGKKYHVYYAPLAAPFSAWGGVGYGSSPFTAQGFGAGHQNWAFMVQAKPLPPPP